MGKNLRTEEVKMIHCDSRNATWFYERKHTGHVIGIIFDESLICDKRKMQKIIQLIVIARAASL